MIIVTTFESQVRVYAEISIGGAWTAARHAKLMKLIEDYVNIAETVDEIRTIQPEEGVAQDRMRRKVSHE